MLARLLALLRRARAPVELRLYTKADCPLCTELAAELARARLARPYTLVEVDIEGDAELHARYGRSIPVLELEGRVLAKGRAGAAELERRFARVLTELEGERGGVARA
jgi:hypothetical protein